jgi:hypothetical protein
VCGKKLLLKYSIFYFLGAVVIEIPSTINEDLNKMYGEDPRKQGKFIYGYDKNDSGFMIIWIFILIVFIICNK